MYRKIFFSTLFSFFFFSIPRERWPAGGVRHLRRVNINASEEAQRALRTLRVCGCLMRRDSLLLETLALFLWAYGVDTRAAKSCQRHVREGVSVSVWGETRRVGVGGFHFQLFVLS